MDGMHDLGGKQGFGQVMHNRDAAVFHQDWEVRANALYSLAVKCGVFNMDEYRHAIERMAPPHYLTAGYYERSLTSLATLCVEKGLVTHEELAQLAGGAYPLAMPSAPGRGNRAKRTAFVSGDQVRVRDEHVAGHVRMPGYIRGKHGVVISKSPVYPFPDAHGHGVPAEDEPTYDVRFEAAHLWPQGAEQAQVHVAVFESYLELNV
ncbi:MAG: nitrile hydratase subunit beta [Limnohabitans sp.]|nr:nitrile hydratase subunit beta [Limnohabitans sp.]